MMMLSTPKFAQKAIAVFFLAILIVSACQITNTRADTKSQNMILAEVKGTVHAPIHITSNSDFASQASANGWPGDGTQGNPYMIDGYDIDGQGGTYCIWIENTSVWFVIRNCKLWNATSTVSEPYGTGICLKNVQHGTLANNNCSGNSYGISLYSSSNYNNITNNNCSGNSYGISLYSSSNNNITNNNCSGNSWGGIYLHSSSNNNNITNNYCSGNSHYGIYLYSSSNNNIMNNTLWNNGIGIGGGSLEHWNTHIIENNTVNGKPVYYYKNQDGGTVHSDAGQVILANCTNMVVSGLTLTNTSIGIELGFSSYNNITNNNCSGNSWGIFLDESCNNNITNNNCSGNSWGGISLAGSSNNNITNNNCSGNEGGIHLSSSNNNNITNNYCSGNSHDGIYLHSSSNNNITNNNCSDNSDDGIYLDSSSNNNITNNNCSGNSHGISLAGSSNNNITYNNFYHNTQYAINIASSSTGNAIHHNNFWQNNGASKGVSGNCQAYDDVGSNTWYDNTAHEGNYWSNWDGQGWGTPNAYPIDGGAGAYDMYPIRTHGPIHITSNSDFASQASANGWPGDGSQGNPYIIDGYDIDGQGGTYCIWIENTDVWFVIRNCKVWNATSGASSPWGTGIYLKNVQHGTLASNNCSGNTNGVYLYLSSTNTITNNNCSGNTNDGIVLDDPSNNNNITNNNCSGNSYGIFLDESCNNIITNNNCSDNSQEGIHLEPSSNYNNITNNNFYHNTYYAIYITSGSTGNTIHHNNFWQNNGAGRGVNGNCQAYDDVGSNTWYDNTAQEGNYWSNWDGNGWGTPNAYPIDGGASAYDMYPLGGPIPELSSIAVIAMAIALLGVALRSRR